MLACCCHLSWPEADAYWKQLLSEQYFYGKTAWLEGRSCDACSGSALDLSTVSMARVPE
jgi:hypothetical protein